VRKKLKMIFLNLSLQKLLDIRLLNQSLMAPRKKKVLKKKRGY
jgi:hypothetical protein